MQGFLGIISRNYGIAEPLQQYQPDLSVEHLFIDLHVFQHFPAVKGLRFVRWQLCPRDQLAHPGGIFSANPAEGL